MTAKARERCLAAAPATALALALPLVLAACAGSEPGGDARAAWDGRWVGGFSAAVGLLGCPQGGSMELRLTRGQVDGVAISAPLRFAVAGTLAPTGEMTDGVLLEGATAVAVVRGTFGVEAAAGRWQGPVCEGSWSLRRFPE